MTAPELADRIRKARRESMGPACYRPSVSATQSAAPPLGWLHVRCAVDRQHEHEQEDDR